MDKILLILFVSFTLSACAFDEQRQLDIRLPATLEIKNSAGQTINLSSIYSTENAKGGFVFDGGSIAPSDSLKQKVTESSYRDLRDGHFVLQGSCGVMQNWSKQGSELVKTENSNRWLISFDIKQCK